MTIIELTLNHNSQHNPIWLNAHSIAYMTIQYRPDEKFTLIYLREGESFAVMELPEEIIELIKKA